MIRDINANALMGPRITQMKTNGKIVPGKVGPPDANVGSIALWAKVGLAKQVPKINKAIVPILRKLEM